MKNFTRSVGGKVTIFMCTVLAIITLVASVAGIIACAATGIYTESKESVVNELYIGRIYNDLSYIASDIISEDGTLYEDPRETNFKYIAYDSEDNIVAKSIDITGNADSTLKYRAEIGIKFKDDKAVYYTDGNNYYRNGIVLSIEDSDNKKTYYYHTAPSGYSEYEVSVIIDGSPEVFDDYYVINSLIEHGYSYKYVLIFTAAASLIASIAFFTALMCVSGRRALHDGEEDKVYPGILNRIPFDILLAAVATVISICIAICVDISYSPDTTMLIFSLVAVAFVTAAVIALTVGLCMSAAARIKQGTLIKNTIIGMIIRFIIKIVKAIYRGIKKVFLNLPLLWKTAAVLAAVSLIELIFILACWLETDVLLMFWLAEKMIMVPAVMWVSICLRKLQAAGEALADGDLEYKADTKGTFWDFKKHAENLNSIADGMSRAVDERMKSERMKTELITNVSHDIKTPLTSIINYADLISREECDNEKISEYAAVLSRQSDRLKRLIEDLVEASKAATGNLEVSLAPCDAGLFISQAVGEYEQKLRDAGLNIITETPENAVLVMADGRRMLRVFDNLMNNICKYALSGTRVYLSLAVENKTAVIVFKNMSCDQLNISVDELMERFVRGDSSRNTEGNGLGLSIAKSLTELQDGTMELAVDGDLFKVILKFPVIGNN